MTGHTRASARAGVIAVSLALSLVSTVVQGSPGSPGEMPDGPLPDLESLARSAALRPLSPDPHPYTTERHRVQIEIEPLSYAYDQRTPEGEHVRTRSWNMPLTLKFGVTDDIDIHVGLNAYASERQNNRETGERSSASGVGDLLIRSKINLWGNDDDQSTALAVMPFVELPTASNDLGISRMHGGVVVPFVWKFADGWDITLAPHLALIHNNDDNKHELEYGLATTLTREIVAGLGVFAEFEAVDDTGDAPWAASLNTGAGFELTGDTAIEVGVGFGLTWAADDLTAHITLVHRF